MLEDERNLAAAAAATLGRERTDMKLAFPEALFTRNLWRKRAKKNNKSEKESAIVQFYFPHSLKSFCTNVKVRKIIVKVYQKVV